MVDYGEFVPEALATSDHGHLRALGDRLDLVFNHDNDSVSYAQLLQLALEGSHAITETYSYLRNFVDDDPHASHQTYMLKEQIYSGALAFFLPKHTPWRFRLSQGIKGLVEGGLVDKWYSDIMGTGGRNSDSRGVDLTPAKNKPLSLSNLQGPFLLLLLGLLLALVTFVSEALADLRQGSRYLNSSKIVM
ncbi:hypothetical protein Pcinc_005705 [Petrolisthes cinctipes]|uniref:Uncharacterized protein n=1 Tax=Petrolisthes cinctipes TaxID=88211 RepID=A0AAE1GC26_PETCI|nr:hypothetical protein Pcinc_005705 [Petrolisthes cinctipes]